MYFHYFHYSVSLNLVEEELSNAVYLIFCIAKFATLHSSILHEVQYPLYTIMCFDEWHNGIPVAYIITSKCAEDDLVPWMTKLRDKLLEDNPDWYPGSVIVDCAQAELNAFT